MSDLDKPAQTPLHRSMVAIPSSEYEALQARVKEQAETIKRLQEAYLPGNWEKLEKYKRVVDAARAIGLQGNGVAGVRLMEALNELDGEKCDTCSKHLNENGECLRIGCVRAR